MKLKKTTPANTNKKTNGEKSGKGVRSETPAAEVIDAAYEVVGSVGGEEPGKDAQYPDAQDVPDVPGAPDAEDPGAENASVTGGEKAGKESGKDAEEGGKEASEEAVKEAAKKPNAFTEKLGAAFSPVSAFFASLFSSKKEPAVHGSRRNEPMIDADFELLDEDFTDISGGVDPNVTSDMERGIDEDDILASPFDDEPSEFFDGNLAPEVSKRLFTTTNIPIIPD